MIHLKFSLPPSVNHSFGWKDIRYKTPEYKKWEQKADNELLSQEKYEIIGDEWLKAHYVLHIDLHCKNWNKRIIDCSNYEKAMSDMLWWYVNPITRKPVWRRYKHLWIQRIPWFQDHKILVNTQEKKQKNELEEDWIEVFITEVI